MSRLLVLPHHLCVPNRRRTVTHAALASGCLESFLGRLGSRILLRGVAVLLVGVALKARDPPRLHAGLAPRLPTALQVVVVVLDDASQRALAVIELVIGVVDSVAFVRMRELLGEPRILGLPLLPLAIEAILR